MRFRSRIALLTLFFSTLIFWSCGDAVPDPDPAPIEEVEEQPDTILTPEQEVMAVGIDTFFQKRAEIKEFNGSVLFAINGKVIHRGNYGYANFKEKDTLTSTTKFQLASLSKPFTAYAIMLLEQQGKLKLTDNVRKYIPAFPYDGITIDLLLSHRSGMSNYMYFVDEIWQEKYVTPISNKEVINLYRQRIPQYYYPPNVRYDYSNTGYMLLASIVEDVSGKDFETFMKEEVFDPIGMKNTLVYRKKKGVDRNIPNEAVGYVGKYKRAEDTYLNGVVGDKGIYSTTEDLLLFDKALREGAPLSLTSLDTAYIPRNEFRKNKDNYGYGWRIRETADDKQVIYHTGWWKGFRSYFIRDIETGSTIIVLTNVKRGPFLSTDALLNLMGLSRPRVEAAS